MLAGEDKFLQAMLEYHDEGSRMVFCDWLEEHSDPRAPILRGTVIENRDDVPLLRKYSTWREVVEVRFMTHTFGYVLFNANHPDIRGASITSHYMRVERETPWLVPMPPHYYPRFVQMPEHKMPLWLRVAVRYWLADQWWPCVKEGYIID